VTWEHYFELLATQLHEARGEELEVRKSIDEVAVFVIGENHTQRWQYDNAMMASSRELKGQLYEIQLEIATIIDLTNTGRVLCAAGFDPPASLPTWLVTTSSI